MITDQLISMDAPELKEKYDKEEIVRFLLDKQKEIESHFPNDEYIKLDLTHGEVLGIKSTAVIGGVLITDMTAINWVTKHSEKYKDAEMINLGNVKMLYEEFKEKGK